MPLFGKSQKSPAELVKALKEAVTALERGDKKAEKAQEDVSKNLVSQMNAWICQIYSIFRLITDWDIFFSFFHQVLIKNMLYGTSDSEPQTDYVVAQLSQELYNSNLLLLLIQVSPLIDNNFASIETTTTTVNKSFWICVLDEMYAITWHITCQPNLI